MTHARLSHNNQNISNDEINVDSSEVNAIRSFLHIKILSHCGEASEVIVECLAPDSPRDHSPTTPLSRVGMAWFKDSAGQPRILASSRVLSGNQSCPEGSNHALQFLILWRRSSFPSSITPFRTCAHEKRPLSDYKATQKAIMAKRALGETNGHDGVCVLAGVGTPPLIIVAGTAAEEEARDQRFDEGGERQFYSPDIKKDQGLCCLSKA